MENGVNIENDKLMKMGATGNPNIGRLAALQERKKSIEESLAKCNQELKQICLQEAELTGAIPQEMPLEPGESPPQVRRRIGTAYSLPENLIKNTNSKDETVTDLELQMQLQAQMAEAALGLANEQNISKTIRRQHLSDYHKHKKQFTALQEKLTTVKDKSQQQQHSEQLYKQKKKPRPTEQEDNISLGTTMNEPFAKSDLRHSLRSNKYVNNELEDQRYLLSNPRLPYKNISNSHLENSYARNEDRLSKGLYALSINGYRSYMERKEGSSNNYISNSNTLQYNQPTQYLQHSPVNTHYTHQAPSYQQIIRSSMYNYPTNQTYNQVSQIVKNSQTNQSNLRTQLRQSSPNINTPKLYHSQNFEHNYNYCLQSNSEQNFHATSPHQIQPHQQYEHMTLGLGGYWKDSGSGELVWCNSSPVESNWQRDKRFGSLDRRKNKRIHKRVSPSVSNKSATLASVPLHVDHMRTRVMKSPQVMSRRSQDNRQLVRTQSLGSVGGQTMDSVWHSDENSSCESDSRSINEAGQAAHKQKQKEWRETFLDGPVSPTHSIVSRSHSTIPSVLSPEEKYILSAPPQVPPPPTPKPPLEIPAESNPSPRIPETNLELFNNNIPKNGTLVQAGHFKPYHEETKPFEMADCYKYSTKFKKSPQKQQPGTDTLRKPLPPTPPFQKNLNETFEKAVPIKNHNYTPGPPMSPSNLDNSLNSSFDLAQLSNANVAERFSDEMNAWYKTHKLQIDNSGNGNSSKGKSTATLV